MTVDLSQGTAWMNGQIMPVSEARIGVTDWGLTHSDITYDVVPVWNGAFFRLEAYLDRFTASMATARIDVGLDRQQITEALHQMVAASGLQRAYVSMVAARGTPVIAGSRDPRFCANHFYAWCVPYIHVIAPELAEQGADVWVSQTTRRIPEDSVNPRVKNYHWGDFTHALFEAKDQGYETVLLCDHAGRVTEGPGFNVFAVKGDRVVTPDRGVLRGVTRDTALTLLQKSGFTTCECPLPLPDLLDADEVFLTSSGGGILPVRRVGERIFSNGTAGPVATRMRYLYYEAMETNADYRTVIRYAEDH